MILVDILLLYSNFYIECNDFEKNRLNFIFFTFNLVAVMWLEVEEVIVSEIRIIVLSRLIAQESLPSMNEWMVNGDDFFSLKYNNNSGEPDLPMNGWMAWLPCVSFFKSATNFIFFPFIHSNDKNTFYILSPLFWIMMLCVAFVSI